MALYQELKGRAGEDVKARMKLAALHATLNHFNVSDPVEQESIAENILRFSEISERRQFKAADKTVEKLMKMHQFYKEQFDE